MSKKYRKLTKNHGKNVEKWVKVKEKLLKIEWNMQKEMQKIGQKLLKNYWKFVK